LINTETSGPLTIAKPDFPSPLKLATTGKLPPKKFTGVWKVPSPLPSSTDTPLTTRSNFPSPLKSPTTIELQKRWRRGRFRGVGLLGRGRSLGRFLIFTGRCRHLLFSLCGDYRIDDIHRSHGAHKQADSGGIRNGDRMAMKSDAVTASQMSSDVSGGRPRQRSHAATENAGFNPRCEFFLGVRPRKTILLDQ
jgi:hypothetical protein